MEKIDSFMISKMSVSNFKCFGEHREFAFGNVNFVTGHNGQGKSSVADAVAYAITGVPYFGEGHLDRLYAEGTKNMKVALELRMPDGSTHLLARERVKDQTGVTYDGLPVRQSDLVAAFGEKDVFLTVFNPLYFAETLGEKGRSLLERRLPVVPREAVLEKLCDEERALIEACGMVSPEGFLKTLREEIKETENDAIYAEGRRDLLNAQVRAANVALIEKRGESAKTQKRLSELESKKTEGTGTEEAKARLSELLARREALLKESREPADTSATDAKILAAKAKLAEKRAGAYASKYAEAIAETAARFALAKERYGAESAALSALKPGARCPACRRIVSNENVGEIKASFDESANALLAEGRDLKSRLAELNELDAKAAAVFENFKNADVAGLEAEIATLEKERDVILIEAEGDARSRAAEADGIEKEIAALEAKILAGNLSEDELIELSALSEEKKRLETEIALMEAPARAARPEKSVDDLRALAREKRKLENAVKSYIAERVKLRFEDFGMLNRVKAMLCETVKSTGEIKDVFRLSYDGRPYPFLSLSEKIKTGLELSALMKRLTNSDYPVFIDNGESVPVIDNIKPSGQIFVARVVKGAPLSVRIAENATGEKTAA